MDSLKIEEQIKGLLGLNLGGGVPTPGAPGTSTQSEILTVSSQPAPGAYPRHKEKPSQKPTGPKHAGEKGSAKKPKVNTVNDGSFNGFQSIEEYFVSEIKKESKVSRAEDYTAPEPVVNYLASKYIRALKKKSTKFLRAQWFCHLCEYHCDNLNKCYEHFIDTRHSRLTRIKEIDTTLANLPSPTKLHCDGLNNLLLNTEREFGLSQDDFLSRQQVVETVQQLLLTKIPGCRVRMYGSSQTGFGLRSSNLNLDLQICKEDKPHLALIQALDLIKDSHKFKNVEDDFSANLPSIRFKAEGNSPSGLDVELSLNNHHALQTSSILQDYMELDPRVRVLGVNFRYWAALTKLDKQAEGTLSPHTFPILLIYFLQRTKQPVVPCIHEYMEDSNDEVYHPNKEKLRGWQSENTDSVAELWIKLFQFYSLTYASSDLVVSIRKAQETTNEEKDWKSKKLAIEDPYSMKRNLCRSIQHPSVFNYIADCFKTGYLYFGTIQTSHGPIITKILPNQERDEDTETNDCTLESWLSSKGTVLTKKQTDVAIKLVPKNMVSFLFSAAHLTDGSVPAVLCAVCSAEGHVTSSCPEEKLPPLLQLPQLRDAYIRALDRICVEVLRNWEPQSAELMNRDHIMIDLNGYIRKFFKNAELTLFGSSSNGFAFRHSDLDISLTFTDKPSADGLNCIQIIEELAEKIKRMSGVKNVLAITSAKVPIIKLFYQNLNVEADISLYNVLARENTRLLSTYSELDQRVKVLGYMVKLFAKVCDIGDASRGSLSSYAYILMMLFYLQQTSPPVIPVLQEMYTGEKPEKVVDGWNAWFQSDKEVISRWRSGNKKSVGQLWIGFLSFFAGEWDDRKLVVCIRQHKPLTKFEKMWNSPCIAIEDPFELSHNLGVGISRRMNIYIKKTFINGRTLFGAPIPVLPRVPQGYRNLQDYFFDHRLLTNGAPPNDRGCRACGKIGHLVADCPRKRSADMRKKAQKDRPRTQSEQQQQNAGRVEGRDEGRNRTRSEIPRGADKGKENLNPSEDQSQVNSAKKLTRKEELKRRFLENKEKKLKKIAAETEEKKGKKKTGSSERVEDENKKRIAEIENIFKKLAAENIKKREEVESVKKDMNAEENSKTNEITNLVKEIDEKWKKKVEAQTNSEDKTGKKKKNKKERKEKKENDEPKKIEMKQMINKNPVIPSSGFNYNQVNSTVGESQFFDYLSPMSQGRIQLEKLNSNFGQLKIVVCSNQKDDKNDLPDQPDHADPRSMAGKPRKVMEKKKMKQEKKKERKQKRNIDEDEYEKPDQPVDEDLLNLAENYLHHKACKQAECCQNVK